MTDVAPAKRRTPNRVYAVKGDLAMREHIDVLVTKKFKDRVADAAVEAGMSTSDFVRHLLRTGMGEVD